MVLTIEGISRILPSPILFQDGSNSVHHHHHQQPMARREVLVTAVKMVVLRVARPTVTQMVRMAIARVVRAMGRTVRLGLVVLGMVRPNPVLKTQGKAEARIIQV